MIMSVYIERISFISLELEVYQIERRREFFETLNRTARYNAKSIVGFSI